MSTESSKSVRASHCSLEQVRSIVEMHLDALAADPERAGVLPPVMLWGPPGVGKSALVRQICADRDIEFLDIRLAQREPVDVRGLPVPVDGAVQWWLPSEYPRDPESRGIIFFDELTAADRTLQVAAYELILDRRLGDLYTVPPGWYLMAAGNRTGDRAVATAMSSALANRFCHLEVDADLETWVRWALANQVHPDVVAFVRFRPNRLLDMQGDLERGWPSPRSWERVGLATEMVDQLDAHTFRHLVRGLIGQGAALEYLAFRGWRESVPDVERMLAGHTPVEVPDAADQRYALCCAVSWHLWKAKNRKTALHVLAVLLAKLPADFAAMLAVDTMNAGTAEDVRELVNHPEFRDWARGQGAFFSERVTANATKLTREALQRAPLPDFPLLADRPPTPNASGEPEE